ncbi:hypothetical protein GQ457_03G014490 [Hibiscus cannabinus]
MFSRFFSSSFQTWILKVNIQCNCDGYKQKIKEPCRKLMCILYTTSIHIDQGKVTVTGVDPAILIRKLEKFGKCAQLWGSSQKVSNNFQNQMTNQFKNMHFDGGKDNTPQMAGGGKNNQQKDESDCDFDEFCDGHGHGHQMQSKMVPMMGKGHGSYGLNGMVNGPPMNGKKGGGRVKNEWEGENKGAYKGNKGSNGGGNNNGNGAKKGGGKNGSGSHEMNKVKNGGFHEIGVINHGSMRNMGQMGYNMGRMGTIQ